MSPSSTSSDFPRLTGADNFDVWKTRVRANLDGKNLLRFVDYADYETMHELAGDDSDENMESASSGGENSDSDDVSNKASASSSDGRDDDDSSSVAAIDGVRNITIQDAQTQDDAEETTADDPALPATAQVASFTATQEAKKARKIAKARAKAAKAKARAKARAIAKAKAKAKAKLSASQIRRLNAQVKSFLMKTLDDKHIRLVKGFDKAYDIYQVICDRYKGTKAYGDPYGIMNFLFNARYKEGDDITEFILKYEDAMAGLNTVLDISLDDNVASVFLFNAMPQSWESEMRIWRSNRDILPYRELKNNLESHVTKKLAHERFALAKGTPESTETLNEKALVSSAPALAPQALAAMGNSSGRTCSYCDRTNHTMTSCRVLARHLQNGEVKPNTVIPTDFKMPSISGSRNFSARGNRQHPYSRGSNRNGGRGDNRDYGQGNRGTGQGNNQGNRGGNNQGNGGYNGNNHGSGGYNGNNQGNDGYNQSRRDNSMTAMIAISAATASTFGLTAAVDNQVDPVWTIDSGCTRHVTYNGSWFTTTMPYTGWITVGGKNQIPILSIGDVSLRVIDSKGQPKTLTLRNVLYAPELKFNLFSVPAAVKDDFRFSFNRTQCTMNTSQRFSIKAKMASAADLYQFRADPAMAISNVDGNAALITAYGFA